jgi:hypothetical protein
LNKNKSVYYEIDDNQKSLDQSLFMLNKFSDLRVNLDKTEATWLGSRRNCHKQLLPDKHLSWNFSGKFYRKKSISEKNIKLVVL